jgi:hypothetical protein
MISASAEPRYEGLKTYSTNLGFLYSISSLKNKYNEDLLQCCKKLQVLQVFQYVPVWYVCQ